ncbi:MAG: sialidase family protein [bacterium]
MKRLKSIKSITLVLSLIWMIDTHAAEQCEQISVHCARTPSAAFDANGDLVVVFAQNDFVYFVRSTDNGRTFRQPVRINTEAEPVYTNGENRPKIVPGKSDQIFVSWSKITPGRFTGDIRFSRSLDGGLTFSPVVTVNDDGLLTTHRFETLGIDSSGNLFIAWVDKRDGDAARTRGKNYPGAAIYYSVSADGGASFSANRRVAANSCECCRIAMTPDESGVAIFWRHIFAGSLRDHAFARLDIDSSTIPVQRATFDHWRIEACPHHGPSMIKLPDDGIGSYHLTWFTNSAQRQGIFYGRGVDGKEDPTNLLKVSNSPGASHPHLIGKESNLWLVWKEFDGDKTHIKLISSNDRGGKWTEEVILASTINESDHPFLLQSGEGTFLSWFTDDEGYRLVDLERSDTL